jgi:predicted nucleic acid-binding protein
MAQGDLIISPVVYAELRAAPMGNKATINALLKDLRIDIDWQLSEIIWHVVAEAYCAYAERRRQGGDAGPKRLLADFIIGAHALKAADQFLTFDQGKYRAAFPDLTLCASESG